MPKPLELGKGALKYNITCYNSNIGIHMLVTLKSTMFGIESIVQVNAQRELTVDEIQNLQQQLRSLYEYEFIDLNIVKAYETFDNKIIMQLVNQNTNDQIVMITMKGDNQ